MVYEHKLRMGFSTRNVEKLIKIVLEKFTGTECDRLPKATISKYMLIEALRWLGFIWPQNLLTVKMMILCYGQTAQLRRYHK